MENTSNSAVNVPFAGTSFTLLGPLPFVRVRTCALNQNADAWLGQAMANRKEFMGSRYIFGYRASDACLTEATADLVEQVKIPKMCYMLQ